MTAAGAVVVEQAGEGALLTAIVALGIYSHEADPEVGHRRHRSRAPVGVLINQAKYHRESPCTQEAAQARLSGQLIDTLRTHPLLAGAEAVVAVPGSQTQFSELLAADLSHGLDVPVHIGRSRIHGGRSAKHHAVKRDFVVDAQLDGLQVVIFDDVLLTSGTLYAMAQAALNAGARRCTGLVAARRLP